METANTYQKFESLYFWAVGYCIMPTLFSMSSLDNEIFGNNPALIPLS